MAKTTDSETIVIMDDELYSITWLIDYLENVGFKVLLATTANEAVEQLSEEIYRAAIIDLNVPMFSPLDSSAEGKAAVYRKYPGLFVALRARELGYRDRQVVIYSVHRVPEVEDEARKIGCTYILKGRPPEMKAELRDILQYDPTMK